MTEKVDKVTKDLEEAQQKVVGAAMAYWMMREEPAGKAATLKELDKACEEMMAVTSTAMTSITEVFQNLATDIKNIKK